MATNQENYPEMPRIRVKPPTPATSTTTTTSTGASPRVTVSTPTATATGAAAETPTAGAARKIAIAVDLSDESAFAVKWAVHHYLRPGDAVVLLHVRPTSVLYGADWGSVDFDTTNFNNNGGDNKDKEGDASVNDDNDDDVKDNKEKESKQKLEDDFDAFTSSKASDLAQPLIQAQVPYKIHIVKDHDMKERLCLEVERHGFNAVIMGSRGFGASKRGSNGRLGSVSDYCVRHCVCPVVVVRYPDEKDVNDGDDAMVTVAEADEVAAEDEEEYHDASDERKATA